MIMYLRLVALFFFTSYATANLASVITKCSDEDTKCLKDFTQNLIPLFAKGDPSMKVDPIDPIFVKTINASSPNLKLVLNDISLTGLKDCVVKKAKRDLQKNKFLFKLMCSVNLEGQYVMDGRLLILPINGKGRNHVSLDKALFVIETDVAENILEDGKKHWIIPKWSYKYELKEKSNIIFENLFNGNEVLSKAAEEVIKDNGNEIIQEVGEPIIEYIIGKVVDSMRQFYTAVPVEELVQN
ncbi:odorant binding protein fmxg18C17 precursor [Danaus plexippus plexippus]|uniref:Odorant binding protein fmxg18C17 n=2 Tax=Danaus plexippus TaxID=13037 RepID=A0A212F1D1_DANPL|nr:circadian clock-controlled protein-like [Danaus plexippus plexippus]OWR47537.1 odorant binding protein fmxg18C17 precursor [Danaus plexippus plexippus]